MRSLPFIPGRERLTEIKTKTVEIASSSNDIDHFDKGGLPRKGAQRSEPRTIVANRQFFRQTAESRGE